MKKIIRVLQINIGSQNFGGVSSIIYNLYSHIDRTEVQFDFLSSNVTTYEMHRAEIEEMGGNIYEFHISTKGMRGKQKYFMKLGAFLREKDYDIVHINSGSPGFNILSLAAVKLHCKSKVIVHSHNAPMNKSKIKKIFYSVCAGIMNRYADLRFACSIAAGKFMFGAEKNFKVVNNGIELDKFKFDENIREKVRSEFLGTSTGETEGKLVFGHIGRMVEQKNPLFVIDVFYEIHKSNNNTVLWMVGDGELKIEIENKIKELGLDTCVELLGYRDDVNDLMMGMDALIFPSFHEGLSIVLIEAQAIGLPVFASDSISQEHKISNKLEFISLSNSAEKWADIILNSNSVYKSQNRSQARINSKYNIKNVAEEVKKYYIDILS